MGFGWRLAAGPVTTSVLRRARDYERGLRGFEMATHTALRSGRPERAAPAGRATLPSHAGFRRQVAGAPRGRSPPAPPKTRLSSAVGISARSATALAGCV